MAVGRKLLVIAYHLLVRGTTYAELGEDYQDRRDRERTMQRLVQRLEALGYSVSLRLREGGAVVERLETAPPLASARAPAGVA